ncbi:hypothetical protein R6Q59_015221 [Mikania micrantha]
MFGRGMHERPFPLFNQDTKKINLYVLFERLIAIYMIHIAFDCKFLKHNLLDSAHYNKAGINLLLGGSVLTLTFRFGFIILPQCWRRSFIFYSHDKLSFAICMYYLS